HEVISPSTHTVFQRAMKSRIVPFRRATEVGAAAVESRGATESAGGGSPGIAAASNAVIPPLSRMPPTGRALPAVAMRRDRLPGPSSGRLGRLEAWPP